MAPNIVFAPNIRRTQNTDTGRKTQTQLITGFQQVHPAGASINFAFCEEIRKFCLGFTMVVYEKIFGSINK